MLRGLGGTAFGSAYMGNPAFVGLCAGMVANLLYAALRDPDCRDDAASQPKEERGEAH